MFACSQEACNKRSKEVELVTSTKLLGFTIANDLTWNDHITEITKKASKRLYSLTQLKRAGVPKQWALSIRPNIPV